MSSSYTVHAAQSMREIDAAQWDACANPQANADLPAAEGERFNPFLTHAFLAALESSKSVGPRSGWIPAHIVVKDPSGQLAAAAPAYFKTHSMGEYVFDHGWADAFHGAGLRYYPKLQVAVPFTPVTGRRLLAAAGHGDAALETLIAALRGLRVKTNASSLHVTFPTHLEWKKLGSCGFLQRTGQQFHFINKGYADFEAFLSDLASRKRKMIRRERKEALATGIEIESLTGASIAERHWDSFFGFYMDTG
ncbi:MAG: GNAT family N-acetyltransferase, partial [Beijerinckiaceae bacterium]|nr:GNAT family N-acetyltransferase [Beijerinckiaceae bacterium]